MRLLIAIGKSVGLILGLGGAILAVILVAGGLVWLAETFGANLFFAGVLAVALVGLVASFYYEDRP